MNDNVMRYKGYSAAIEFSVENKVLQGKIDGIDDLVDFCSEDIGSIEEEFHKAVDGYLELCEKIGKEPNKERMRLSHLKEKSMDDLKEAIIFTVNNSKARNSVELFCELLSLLYSKGFRDGQHYVDEREREECRLQYDEGNKPYSCLECDYSMLSEEQKKKCPCLGNSDCVSYENRPNGCPYDG